MTTAEIFVRTLLWALAAGVAGAGLSIAAASRRNGITPMPASAPVRKATVNEAVRLGGRGLLVEAGSGWGTLAVALAAAFPGRRIEGVENSVIPYAVSRLIGRGAAGIARKLRKTGFAELRFKRADLYAYPYERANGVVCYLYPGAMERLAPILRERLRPGAFVISVCFALPGRRPDRVVECADWYRTKIYVYCPPDWQADE